MNGWETLGLFLAAAVLSPIVFCVVAYWPQRPPGDRTVDEIGKCTEGDEGSGQENHV